MAVVRASSNRLGDYLLLERLGVGGMAEVFVAEREGPYGFVKRVALKRILPGLAADRRFAEMFCDEARVSAALNHPNIVQVLDFGECDGELFMAMEFVEGVTVAKLLRMAASAKRPIPMAIALYVVHEVLRGLDYAHEARDEEGRPLRLVHRDVSPGNMLLGFSGEVKLSDFGIARSEVVARRTHPGELKGKMGYMSPEQVGGLEIDRRSDLFTAGIVLAELLLLRPLFQGKNELETLTRINRVDLGVLERHGQGLPRGVRTVLDRALQRDPNRRFASAGQFADALSQAARAEGMLLSSEAMAAWLRDAAGRPDAPGASPSGSLPRVQDGPRRPESGARRAERSSARDRSVALRAADGASLGIVTLTELMGRVATGRVPLDAWGSMNGAPWVPLSALPGVAGLRARSAYDFGEAASQRPPPSGAQVAPPQRIRFEQRMLPSYVYQAVREGRTALLVVRSGERARRIYVREGQIEFVASTDAAHLLGELLMAEGAIAPDELDDCLVKAAETGGRLGEVLTARGHLRQSTLLRLLSQQREQRLASMFAWTSGSLSVLPGEPSGEPVLSGAAGAALVSAAVRRGLGDDVLAQALAPLRNAVIVPSGANFEPTLLGLTDSELRCLRLVLPGGALREAPLRAVVEMCRTERLCRGREALLALFIALSAGLLSAVS
jgi:serine/threonine-protein kinase